MEAPECPRTWRRPRRPPTALNPITFTEKVVGDFLRYQLTTYPFADERLHAQMRALLSLDRTRHTPLLRGPYVSLSRAFRTGASVKELVTEGLLHPFMEILVPYQRLYGHQERAIRAIVAGRTTLVSTGTGSGKTEAFLYPIVSRCLRLRDESAPPGIVAVLVYPMNALAEDQLGRLRDLLAGTGIPFGMYVGKTPERTADVPGERLRGGSSRADFRAAFERAQREKRGTAVHPPEERVSREDMRAAGKQPRILLTNVKQLELLLTRLKDVELFAGARLEFLVFDEAHTYEGAAGAETACLIRRLRSYCGREASETVCVGTSATLADPGGGIQAATDFA
ncbi:MAG: DEAD/DEAH box helicase, partial [Vicinamibacteria bacterium]